MDTFDVKKTGEEISIEVAKLVFSKLIMPAAKQYIENSPNKIDDLLLPFMPQVEAAVLAALDKLEAAVVGAVDTTKAA